MDELNALIRVIRAAGGWLWVVLVLAALLSLCGPEPPPCPPEICLPDYMKIEPGGDIPGLPTHDETDEAGAEARRAPRPGN